MKTLTFLLLLLHSLFASSQIHVYYDGNGSDNDNVPIDTNSYLPGEMAMVQWEEPLTASGLTFSCWNTQPDGSGTNYSPDAYSSGPTLVITNSDISLFAQWGSCSESPINRALVFNSGTFLDEDDTFESIDIENMPIFTESITIEGWINPSTFTNEEANNNPVILKFYTEDIYIGLINNGNQHVLSWNGWDAYGETAISENQWTHFAIVVGTSGIEAMYINGQPETYNQDGSPITLPSSNQWVIGNMTWSSSPYRWHGMIDELRVWSTSRTPSEILTHYNIQLNGDEAGLFAYWNFDHGSSTQLLCDKNLNGNNHIGVLRNMENTDWTTGAPLLTTHIEPIKTVVPFIFPNPANHFFYIQNENKNPSTTYIIYNGQGKILMKGKTTSFREKISVKNYPPGIYFIEIITSSKKKTYKIDIQ